jgi:hypothetical protein
MSGQPKKTSKTSVAALAEKLAAGTQKYLANQNSILVEGGTFTAQQVIAQLNALAALRQAVDAAKAVVKGKVADERAKAPALVLFMDAYEGFVRSAFGNKPEVLADFGLAPKKVRTPPTAEQLAAAKAKRAATRKARGIMRKKDKLALKGNVTGVLVTPVTEPAPVPAVTPAPSPAPNGAAR